MRPIPAVIAAATVCCCALSGCAHRAPRPGPAPTGAHYLIGKPFFADGQWRYPRAFSRYDRTGLATMIAPGHDAATTDGEAFDQSGLMAQSPVLPLPSLVSITNLANGRTVTVRVNDRGPATAGRIVAVTRRVARDLEFPQGGTAEVRVTLLTEESSALQTELGTGPHLVAAPVASVQASALPPPAGAVGSAGDIGLAQAQPTLATTPVGTGAALSGTVTLAPADPGTLYVEMGGFGSANDAQSLLFRLMGMPGQVVPQQGEGRTLYGVKLGPYRSVAAADAALRAVLQRGVADPEITVR